LAREDPPSSFTHSVTGWDAFISFSLVELVVVSGPNVLQHARPALRLLHVFPSLCNPVPGDRLADMFRHPFPTRMLTILLAPENFSRASQYRSPRILR
ncbi:hypothetical protein, partial [Burkholderia stagnalis]